MSLARQALTLAGKKLGHDLIIRRPRGVENVLTIRLKPTK